MFSGCCCCATGESENAKRIGIVSVHDGYTVAESKVETDDAAGTGEDGVFTAPLGNDTPGQWLGMVVEQFAAEALFIAKIEENEGTVVSRYNSRAPLERKLQPGDYIMSVDGVTGDAALDRLTNTPQVEMVVKRPKLFDISMSKGGMALGLILKYDKLGTSLYVKAVEDDGAAKATGADLESGDRIVMVNGKAGSPPILMEELKNCETLSLRISRP
mmetsp:Transcript_122004/g.352482  ORF Transcript_122004/g.352482 Transcript_122004/m.352482 type:complete len:216 (-) Transcript_122004:174-821(-)